MTDLNNMNRADLTALLNELTGSNVKPTSYTKSVLIEKITKAQTEVEEETPAEVEEETPAEVEEETPAPAGGDEELECPLCPFVGNAEDFPTLGEEGTPLGACRTCPECKKSFNEFTGEEVPAPKAKKKRKILNPQPVIDAKTELLLEKTGAELWYDRQERLWTISHEALEDAIYLASRELAILSKESLVELVQFKLKK